jgi:hypothetical protein
MRLEHAIFHGPLAVELEMEDVDTPKDYREWPEGADLPSKLRAWKVQSKTYPVIDPGLVSDPYGFEDSPDSEWISGGVNSKGPRSMAVGRQGNLFLWGFFAQPSDMTESGRRVFVNSIVYMKQFDGPRAIVYPRSGWGKARDWALVYAGYADSLKADPSNAERVKQLFPTRVVASIGLDGKKLAAFYRDNFEMLHLVQEPTPTGRGSFYGFDVDDDCKRLGIGNSSQEFVPALIARLEKDPSDALAVNLMHRYVGIAPSLEPAKLRAWFTEQKSRLFFSDRKGFQWLIDTRTSEADAKKDK